MKKKITAVALLVILLALGALGSAAYFTAEGRATNVVSTNAISMKIDENGDFTWTNGVYELPGNLMPSQTADLQVSIQNVGPEPFYTRVKVDVDIRDSSGQAMGNEYDKYVGLNIKSGWVESEGWYYYNGNGNPVVDKQSSPQLIFDTVTLKPDTPNEMKNAKVSIVVTAQAVQTKNNEIPAGGVTAVRGWPSNS